MVQKRPVDLWTTRPTELPTSSTGLFYDYEFRQSISTRNDEGPEFTHPDSKRDTHFYKQPQDFYKTHAC